MKLKYLIMAKVCMGKLTVQLIYQVCVFYQHLKTLVGPTKVRNPITRQWLDMGNLRIQTGDHEML